MPIKIFTSKSFSWGNSIPFKRGYFCFISDVSYLLKGIPRLFTSHADSFDEYFKANELALTEAIVESILSDFDKALVTVNCCWLPSRFILFLTRLCLIHSLRVHSFKLKEVQLIILSVWLAKRCDSLQFVYVPLLQFHLMVRMFLFYDCQLHDGSSGNSD